MTWTAVGSINPNGATGNFSFTPSAASDLVIVWVCQFANAAVTATALSSSNVTWTLVGSVLGTNAPNMTVAMFAGTVTSASSATVSITWSGTAPTGSIFISGQEFHSSLGGWTVDASATLNVGGGSSWPNMTASAAGDLYAGYALDGGSAVAGTTSGYTFLLDSGSNGMAYNLSCGSGTVTGPTWGDAGQLCGVMALIAETGGGPLPAAPQLPQPGGRAWRRRHRRGRAPAFPPAAASAPPPCITGLAGSGTAGYFQDSNGSPRLLLMEMAWGLPGNAGRWNSGNWQSDMDAYFTARAAQGYTAWWGVPWINHQIDSTAPNTDGRTWDGIYPFTVNGTPGTITSSGQAVALNDPFWQRTDDLITSAKSHGITVLLNLGMEYDFQAGWIWGSGASSAQMTTIGGLLAARYPQSGYPNLQWVFGDDDVGDDFGPKFGALLTGIRNAGDTRNAVSMEQTTDTNCHIEFDTGAVYASGGFGMTSAQWNLSYSYKPSYVGVEASYTETGTTLLPVVYGDGVWYGDTDNSTPDYTIRRFCWWALASGARGLHCTDGPSAAGSTLWTWQSGAAAALTSDPNGTWVTGHIGGVRAFIEGLTDWHKLVPDTSGVFVTAGRGTKATAGAPQNFVVNYGNTDSYVTASITPAGTLAVIYCGQHFSITIDQSKMAAGYTATWVDPSSLAVSSSTPGSTYNSTALGNNSAGNPDWALVLQAPPGAVAGSASLSGTGSLTAAATVAAPAALSGSGTLAAAAVVAAPAALSGSGSLSTAAAVTAPASLSGSGSLAAAATVAAPASLSGTGTLSAAATVAAPASLSGAGTLSAPATVSAPASLSGSGSLAAASLVTVPGGAALSGSGTLSAAVTVTAPASLSGSGTLSASQSGAVTGTAALSGTGTLTAAVTVTAPAALSGTGSLTAAAAVAGTALLSGTGSLAAALAVTPPAALSGSGSLSGPATVSAPASLAGSGTLAASPSGSVTGTAALSGTGSLGAAAFLSGPGALSGSGSLTAAFLVTVPGAAALSGSGTLLAAATVTVTAAASLTGSGSLTAGAVLVLRAAVPLSGTGSLTVTARVIVPVTEPAVTWTAQPAAPRWKAVPAPPRWRIIMAQFAPVAALSLECVNVTWTANLDGTAVDPTGQAPGQPALPVYFAFPQTSGDFARPAEPAVWFPGSWLLGGTGIGFVSQCLVGPGGAVTLTAGLVFDCWSKVTGSPEVPVKFAGTLAVF